MFHINVLEFHAVFINTWLIGSTYNTGDQVFYDVNKTSESEIMSVIIRFKKPRI